MKTLHACAANGLSSNQPTNMGKRDEWPGRGRNPLGPPRHGLTAPPVRETAAQIVLAEDASRHALDLIARRKKTLIFGLSTGAFLFFLALPILSFFTTALDGRAVGALTWAYVLMFAQFAMGLICIHFFIARAAAFDEAARVARAGSSGGRRPS